MKQLVTNGDDFGYARSMNDAIIRAHKHGILTSASLMPCGYDFDHAVDLARPTPTLSVGVHICLLQARAILPHAEIPAITDEAGDFHNNPIVAGLKWFLVPGVSQQIEREARAQMDKFLATGLRPSHINTHMHLHAHPVVFPIIAKLGREHGIRFLRVPRESFASLMLDRRFLKQKLARLAFFWLLTLGLRKRIARAGFRSPDAIYGLLQTGHLDEDYLTRVLCHLEDGVTEIYFHPGKDNDPILHRWQPDYDHASETTALLSPKLKRLIRDLGIRLTYFEAAIEKPAVEHGAKPLPSSQAGTFDTAGNKR